MRTIADDIIEPIIDKINGSNLRTWQKFLISLVLVVVLTPVIIFSVIILWNLSIWAIAWFIVFGPP